MDGFFTAHGEVSASFDNTLNMMTINISGPFNMEFMALYANVVGQIRETITSPCWSSLVHVHGLGLAPMEAIGFAAELVKEAQRAGLVATGVIFHDASALATQQSFWSRVYENADLPFAFFQDEQKATVWLCEKVQDCMNQRASIGSKKGVNINSSIS